MPWPKGVSGNPGGRRKLTLEEKQALEILRSLTPQAAKRHRELLELGAETAQERQVLLMAIKALYEVTRLQEAEGAEELPVLPLSEEVALLESVLQTKRAELKGQQS